MIGYIDGNGPEETFEGYLVFKQPVEGSKKVFILTEEELREKLARPNDATWRIDDTIKELECSTE